MKRNKEVKVENIFLLLASIFVLTFMIAQPINRVPDETNHARMTWEIFHKPTSRTYKWMDKRVQATVLREDRYDARRVCLWL